MRSELPTDPVSSWIGNVGSPSRWFGWNSDDTELYEEGDEFVLSVEMPGFDKDEIDVNWYEGRLRISAEHEDEAKGKRKTYHRTFRLPKEIEPDEINATYRNGVLEVRLPIAESAATRGHTIEVEG